MRIQGFSSAGVARLVVGLCIAATAGCGSSVLPGTTGDPRSTLNLSALDDPSGSVYYEANPNDWFDLAEPVALKSEPWEIRGYISGANDVDVFALGPLEAGDRVLITMTPNDSLYGAIALFSDDGTSLLVNDHRNVYLGRTEPFVDVVMPYSLTASYVAVAPTPGFTGAGNYRLVASKEPSAQPRASRPDVVLLDFTGSRGVKIGQRSPIDTLPFDASDISPLFTGQTDRLMREVVKRVRADYEAYSVTVLSTNEGDRYAPGATRVFFGAYDAALLGVAEGVDEFNATTNQQAIIFTDTFEAFVPLDPTLEELGQAIANVASHEIGHLLGMVHTDDPTGIMDVSASLNELLENQEFSRSPIYTSVFPLGYQDAMTYLLDVVGGDRDLAERKARRLERRKTLVQRDLNAPPARQLLRLSSCGLEDH